MKSLTKEKTNKFKEEYLKNPSFKTLQKALVKNSIFEISSVLETEQDVTFMFSNDLETLPVTHQGATGRCWLFAGLNVLREKAAKQFNVKNIEFSQSYLFFWDKFEKINFFIQSMDDFLDVDIDDRTLKHLLGQGIQDGGQWDMYVNLVNKYGIVPKDVYPDTFTGRNSRYLNRLVDIQLRKYAHDARNLFSLGQKDEIEQLKEETLSNLFGLLVNTLGTPPEKFNFEYVDKNKKYHLIKDLDPISFYESLNVNLDDYVSIINAPTKDKPFNKSYTVSYLGNVIGGKEINHLNLKIERMQELMINQLNDNEVVWFGCDVSHYNDRKEGIWDNNRYDFDGTFEMDFQMTKAERLDYLGGTMNHAMIITGVNLDEEEPTKWKIANSWGEEPGQKGYYLMSQSWFLQHTYQAVVHKKYLTKEELASYNSKPIVLKPWDPMGSLA